MAAQYNQIWSATMNCQKFAHKFITEVLGLNWPDNVQVAGDVIPVVIDAAIFCISTSNSTKKKKKRKSRRNSNN
jgi:hypothetical protein